MLITDGVSDAFGSSSEIIDYLRSVPAKNPQTLADSIIEKALSLRTKKIIYTKHITHNESNHQSGQRTGLSMGSALHRVKNQG